MMTVLDGLRISHESELDTDLHSENVKLDVGEIAMCSKLIEVAGRGSFCGHLLRWICFVVISVGLLRRQSLLVCTSYCVSVLTDTTNIVAPEMERTPKTKK